MPRWMLWAAALMAALAAWSVLAARAGAFSGQPPTDLGVSDGRLKAPSRTPNSVSSQARMWPGHPMQDNAYIYPLALRGSGQDTLDRIGLAIQATPGARQV